MSKIFYAGQWWRAIGWSLVLQRLVGLREEDSKLVIESWSPDSTHVRQRVDSQNLPALAVVDMFAHLISAQQ